MAELRTHRSNGSSILFAMIASLFTVGPIVGLMALTLFATAALLVITGPLMLLFSPLIVPAGLFFAVLLTAIGAAMVMSFVGLRALKWAVYDVGGLVPGRIFGGNVLEGKDYPAYLRQKALGFQPKILQST